MFHQTYEPRNKKSSVFAYAKTKALISCLETAQLISAFVFATIPLLPKFEISSLRPSSVAIQLGLCLTWSETPSKGFVYEAAHI